MTTTALHLTPVLPAFAGERSATPRPALRLTRRGRLALFVLALALVLATGLWAAAASIADADGGAPAPSRVVVVGPGETLWGIAETTVAATGEGDVRSLVAEIQDVNGLDSGFVAAGQELRVPLG